MSVDNYKLYILLIYTQYFPLVQERIMLFSSSWHYSHHQPPVSRCSRLLRSQLQSLLIVARIQMANDQEIIGRPDSGSSWKRLQLRKQKLPHILWKRKSKDHKKDLLVLNTPKANEDFLGLRLQAKGFHEMSIFSVKQYFNIVLQLSSTICMLQHDFSIRTLVAWKVLELRETFIMAVSTLPSEDRPLHWVADKLYSAMRLCEQISFISRRKHAAKRVT